VADIDPVAGMNANRFAGRGAGGRGSYGFLYLTWAGLAHAAGAAAAGTDVHSANAAEQICGIPIAGVGYPGCVRT
jgi:hypothetical protein